MFSRLHIYCKYLAIIASLVISICPASASIVKAQSPTDSKATGKVTDPEMNGLSGSSVLFFNKKTNLPVNRATTVDGGVFVCPNMDVGEYTVSASHPGYVEYKATQFFLYTPLGVTKNVGDHPPVFTLGLTTIFGLITDTDDHPIEGAIIRIYGKGNKPIYTGETAKNGGYSIYYVGRDMSQHERSFTYKIDVVYRGVVYKGNVSPLKNVTLRRNSLGRLPAVLPKPVNFKLLPNGTWAQIAHPSDGSSKHEASSIAFQSGIRQKDIAANYGENTLGDQSPPSNGNVEGRSEIISYIETDASVLSKHNYSASIEGRIVDQQNRGLPDVNVILVNESNGDTYATITESSGEYQFTDITPGVYTLSTSKTGFQESESQGINLAPDQPLARDISLIKSNITTPTNLQGGQLGTVTQNISFGQRSDIPRSGNFDAQQFNALPIGGMADMRSFDEMALLVPGVSPPPYTPGVRGPGVGFGIGTTGKFSVNGMRARSNNFSVDGSDNNDPDIGVRRQGFVALVPQTIESINGVQILTLLWDSELGRSFGSQVNAVTKYGGKDLHGQVYSFFTDSRLNARNFFDYTGGISAGENPYTRTQSGLVLEGPLLNISKTFFFSSFEHLSINTSTEEHFSSPTPNQRAFRRIGKLGVLDPLFQNNPNVFFKGRGVAPLGRNILSFYPEPNNAGGPYGDNTYTEILPASGSGAIFSSKITHQLEENKSVNVRYNFTDDDRILPSVNRGIRSTTVADTRTQNLSIIFNSDLSRQFFNHTRFSFGRTRLIFSGYPDSPFLFSNRSIEQINNLAGTPFTTTSETGLIGELAVEPFSPVGIDVSVFPQRWVDNTFQYADTITWVRNNHTIKTGFDIHRIQLNSRQERNFRPRVVFGNAQLIMGNIDLSINNDPNDPAPFDPGTGNNQEFVSGLELAAIGLPSSIFQTITLGAPDPTIGLRFTEFNLFFNDNWRVRSNLTLDYGLRYEFHTVPIEVNKRIERALRLEELPLPGASRFDSAERQAVFNEAVNAYNKVVGGRDRIYNADRNNFGPHLGFIWLPLKNDRTILRGGYGIYFDTILGAVVSQSRNIFPTEISLNVDPKLGGFDVFNLSNPGLLQVAEGNSGIGIPLILPGTVNQLGGKPEDAAAFIGDLFLRNREGGGLAFTLPSKDIRTPYAQHWHLTVERQVLPDLMISAAYVGTKGTKLTRLTTPNLGPNLTMLIPVAKTFTARNSNDTVPDPLTSIGLPPILIIPKKVESVRRTRPTPELGAYQLFENSANSVYHAFQIEARRRFSSGYMFTAAYTWSHALDDVSDILPISGAPILPQNSFNHRLERASASFDVRHRFAASFIWDLPFYRYSSKTISRWVGGWQVASIIQAHTGQPFTINVPVDANLDGNLTDRPSTSSGLVFLQGHGPQRVAISPGRKVSDFFTFGQDGVVGRNTVRGDNFINIDLALSKNFSLSTNSNLQFRTEFFNTLNRANFGLPIRTIGAPSFGSSVDTINPARTIQFSLKFSF